MGAGYSCDVDDDASTVNGKTPTKSTEKADSKPKKSKVKKSKVDVPADGGAEEKPSAKNNKDKVEKSKNKNNVSSKGKTDSAKSKKSSKNKNNVSPVLEEADESSESPSGSDNLNNSSKKKKDNKDIKKKSTKQKSKKDANNHHIEEQKDEDVEDKIEDKSNREEGEKGGGSDGESEEDNESSDEGQESSEKEDDTDDSTESGEKSKKKQEKNDKVGKKSAGGKNKNNHEMVIDEESLSPLGVSSVVRDKEMTAVMTDAQVNDGGSSTVAGGVLDGKGASFTTGSVSSSVRFSGVVREISLANWETDVKKSPANIFMMYYASWCSFCKKMKPVMVQLAETFKDNNSIMISQMNAVTESPPGLTIRHFPTFYFHKSFGGLATEYKGNHEFLEFQKAIKKFLEQ